MKIDISRIRDIAGDDDELVKTLFELFIDSYKNCLNKMEASLAEPSEEIRDDMWHMACHELKGSSYNLGFTDLGDFCNVAEKSADLESMQSSFEMFKVQFVEVQNYISKIG